MDWDSFGQQQQRPFDQGGPYTASADWVERVMSAEYNLAQQRGDRRNAADALGRLLGFILQNRRG